MKVKNSLKSLKNRKGIKCIVIRQGVKFVIADGTKGSKKVKARVGGKKRKK